MKKVVFLSSVLLLWFSALTLCEQYGEIRVETATAALWHFGGNALDETTNNNDCTADATLVSDGKFGQAYEWDSSGDDLNCGSDSSIDNSAPVTYLFWINPDTAGESSQGILFTKGAGVEDEFRGLSIATNQLSFGVATTGGSWGSVSRQTTTTLSYGEWQHVAVTYDGGLLYTGIHIYINGSEDAVYSNETNGTVSVGDDSAHDFIIGNVSAENKTFDGHIDEVAVIDRVFTSTEIRQIYAEQKGAYGIQ